MATKAKRGCFSSRSKALLAIQAVVDAQAEDDGLWFVAQTLPEAYLQQELRKLHAEVEKHTKIANAALTGGKAVPSSGVVGSSDSEVQ